jgi:hypothetical protein
MRWIGCDPLESLEIRVNRSHASSARSTKKGTYSLLVLGLNGFCQIDERFVTLIASPQEEALKGNALSFA